MTTTLFSLGQTVMTPGVQALVAGNWDLVRGVLARHQAGDWGDLDPEDKTTNDRAVKDGDRILSSYLIGGEKVWVITEWDRSVTTLLLPEEY